MGSHATPKTGMTFWDVMTSPKARKFQIAVLGILLSAATGGLIPAPFSVWIILGINTMVAYGVFQIPNLVPKPNVDHTAYEDDAVG